MKLLKLGIIWSLLSAIECRGRGRNMINKENRANNQIDSSRRNGKFLSIFEVVRFNNEPCSGSGNQNGTCYTAAECESRNGVSQGVCAQGYGVCCVFIANTCGTTSQENCTYFQNPVTVPTNAECRLTVCPCSSNICQLRLDFDAFSITGPSTGTVTVGKALNNEIAGGAAGTGRPVTSAGQCLTDLFSITSPGGNPPPVICGLNTMQHLYVDASRGDCNDLVFQLGGDPVDADAINRRWNIKVTQYSCDFDNLAPSGCDQYFFGSSTGLVQTFNFDGGRHLADQNQVVCVRRERGECRICWFAPMLTDFQFSDGGNAGINMPTKCCSYGADGKDVLGYDCASIPGAEKAMTNTMFLPAQFCGRSNGLFTTGNAKTVCSRLEPFQIRFNSDTFENMVEAPNAAFDQGNGVKLEFFLTNTNCN